MVAGSNSGARARAVRQTSDEERLTPAERATIIDAQATHLLGTTLRLRGDAQAAKAAQIKGLADALAVREGERKSVVSGKSVSVRVDFGGRRIIKKKTFSTLIHMPSRIKS